MLYAGHAFAFQNSTAQVIGSAKLNGIPLGYNAYSAMPSAHMAMALLVTSSVLVLTRSRLVRVLALLYPFLMLFTVTVSGNHYLLDAAGGAVAVVLASVIALAVEPSHRHLGGMHASMLEVVRVATSGHGGGLPRHAAAIRHSHTTTELLTNRSHQRDAGERWSAFAHEWWPRPVWSGSQRPARYGRSPPDSSTQDRGHLRLKVLPAGPE